MSDQTKKPETENCEAVVVSGGFGELPATQGQMGFGASNVPYLGFYSLKSNHAFELQVAIPGISEGRPFLGSGMLYLDLANVPVVIAMVSPVWYAKINTASPFDVLKVSATETPECNAEVVACAGLALAPDGVVPFSASLRTTKVGPAKIAAHVAAASEKPGWADNKVKEGLLKLPAMLRHAGVLTCATKTGKSGVYSVARWAPAPLTIEQAVAVREFTGPNFDSADCLALQKAFASRVEKYQAVQG